MSPPTYMYKCYIIIFITACMIRFSQYYFLSATLGKSETNINYVFFQQMQLPSVMPILELELAQCFCTLLAALAEKLTLLSALNLAPVSTVCEATQMMLE